MSATNLKNRFKIHKSDIHTKKDRWNIAQYYNKKCCDPQDPCKYFAVQITDDIRTNDNGDVKKLL